jgi:hypothetical protein
MEVYSMQNRQDFQLKIVDILHEGGFDVDVCAHTTKTMVRVQYERA